MDSSRASDGILGIIRRLTGLLHPEWGLHIGPAGVRASREQGQTGLRSEGEVLSRLGAQGEPRLVVEWLARAGLELAKLENLDAGTVESCWAPRSRWRQVNVERLRLCHLEGARLEGVALGEAVVCNLQDVHATGGTWHDLALVDLARARLEQVRLERAVSCDFSFATLQGCDLTGADLRGTVWRRARFVDTDPSLAMVDGADFRGARGLDPATRRKLLVAGARFRAASWVRLLRWLAPGLEPLRAERVAVVIQWMAAGSAGLVCLAVLLSVLIPPTVLPIPEVPVARQRQATAREVELTQQGLARLREALQQAHERMTSNGAPADSWPSMEDFQMNRFDDDGDLPGTATSELVPGGLPENHLTDAMGGVLPYCNEVPSQETLAGVDADWHYCDRTGRVFASAGNTGLTTMQW